MTIAVKCVADSASDAIPAASAGKVKQDCDPNDRTRRSCDPAPVVNPSATMHNLVRVPRQALRVSLMEYALYVRARPPGAEEPRAFNPRPLVRWTAASSSTVI